MVGREIEKVDHRKLNIGSSTVGYPLQHANETRVWVGHQWLFGIFPHVRERGVTQYIGRFEIRWKVCVNYSLDVALLIKEESTIRFTLNPY